MSSLAPFASSPSQAASAAQLLAPSGLAQAAAQRTATAPSAAGAAGPLAQPSVQAQIALSAANLAKAAQALSAMNASQAAASAASQLTLNGVPLSGSTWNGTPLSGMQPVNDTNPALWTNAEPLSQDASNQRLPGGAPEPNATATTLTVVQTAPNALLTWQSFDLNPGETLVFDQQGNSTWTVMNRIVAGTNSAGAYVQQMSPSYILGSIQAPGSVYVINPNGIIFGPNSQINVHSLIASSLDVGSPTMTLDQRNAFFLDDGIASATGTESSFSYGQNDTVLEGNVLVEAGASITTTLLPTSVSPETGGFVYLIAPNVENDGTITTPDGETMLVAAQNLQLTPNAYAIGGQSGSTFRATGIAFNVVNDQIQPWRDDGVTSAEITAPGSVTNNGLIDADAGVVILNGDNVTNGGIIQANTSVTRNGEIFLDARLQLTLGAASAVLVQPDEDGETIPQSAIASFTPGSVEMSGNIVDLASSSATQSGALVLNSGGAVTVNAVGPPAITTSYPSDNPNPADNAEDIVQQEELATPRIYMDSYSAIDVSGLDGVTLPMSANLITIQPFGNEFANEPLQRGGALVGQDLTIDIRQSGTFDGTPWVGTPLIADVSGFIGDIERNIDYLLTTGGTVTMNTPASGGEIIQRQGSSINVAGGYVQYQGGVVATTNLVAADGTIVNIADANPLETYVGVAGTTTLDHPHWGSTATETFVSPLMQGGQYEAGYVEGRDAGGITLNATSYVLDGTFAAGVVVGQLQAEGGELPSLTSTNPLDGRLLQIGLNASGTLTTDFHAMPSGGYFNIAGENNLVIQEAVTPLPGDFTLSSPLASDTTYDRTDNTLLPAEMLTQAGFSRITGDFTGSVTVAAGANLTVANGGTIDLIGGYSTVGLDGETTSGSAIDIDGQLVAPSGNITIEETGFVFGQLPNVKMTSFVPTSPAQSNLFTLTIGPDAVLDAGGEWVNDAGASAETLIGGAYINGGTITLETDQRSALCPDCTTVPGGAPAGIDLTGNIVISDGSVIDVSSGGRITPAGQLQLDAQGQPAGQGGNLALLTYNNASFLSQPLDTLAPLSANVVFQGFPGNPDAATALDAIVSAYGFASGGTLSIQTPLIQIGGTPTAVPGEFYLPASFFAGNAFGGYQLSAVGGGGVTAVGPDGTMEPVPGIAVDDAMILHQQNFVASASDLLGTPTGTKLASVSPIGYQPDIIRSPVNLALSSSLAPLPSTPYVPPSNPNTPLPPAVALQIGADAAIVADPSAKISLSVDGRPKETASPIIDFSLNIAPETGVAEIDGSISAPGGTISLTDGTGLAASEVWLGPQSLLNVSGLAIPDTRLTAFPTGTVLPGGTVSVSLINSGSFFVGEAGATIDASGAEGVFDVLQDASHGPKEVPTALWSNAGSITLSAPNLLYDGSFVAEPGASAASGGSLAIEQVLSAGTMFTVQQGGSVAAGLGPTDVPLPGFFFQADSLTNSGIAAVTLASSTTSIITLGDDTSVPLKFAPGAIQFSGNVDISGLNALSVDASLIALTNVVAPTDASGCNVCLSANVVTLLGTGNVMPVASAGVLTAEASAIDLAVGGSTSFTWLALDAAQSNFISSGDIRLRVPLAEVQENPLPGTLPAGELITAGNMTLQAAQIYPISDVDITLKSIGSDGSITILPNGTAAAAPLSAGGQVTLSAANVAQDGTLLAPLGTIRLGAQSVSDLSPNDYTIDPATGEEVFTFVPTESVTLGTGSITSVSLVGMTVPFGETENGTSWSYDSTIGTPLLAPPVKSISVSGAAIDLQSGATIDVQGGGDLQAMEFVPGLGGSQNVLEGANVYAIIPGYNPLLPPLDLDFVFVQGDAIPPSGQSVYLSGGGGLAAGYYTLLPADYATLPGAYRIALVPKSQNAVTAENTTLADGTAVVAGYFANPEAGTQNAQSDAFYVQSSAVWTQYSEINLTSGNAFFSVPASGSTVPPLLPQDAGAIAFKALSTLNLAGTVLGAPAARGLDAQLDIAAQDLQILSPGATPLSGYVGVSADQLTALGLDTLVLGGVSDGAAMTPVANNVELSNDDKSPLTAAEIIFITNASGGITLGPGSVLGASGTPSPGDPTSYTVGNSTAGISGSGSFLAITSGAPLTFERQNDKQSGGSISIAAGATISGAALTLDTTGNIAVDGTATLGAPTIDIASAGINFGTAPQNASGFTVSSGVLTQLEQATTLDLQSTEAIDFYGVVSLVLAEPTSELVLDAEALQANKNGKVTLGAGEVDLTDSGTGKSPTAACGPKSDSGFCGQLTINAGDIVFDAGDTVLRAFESADFVAQSEIAVRGSGSFDGGAANLTFDTPLLLVGAGAQQSITTTGAITLKNSSGTVGTPTGAAEIGGTLTMTAASISDNTLIQATAGAVTLEATGASGGNITLGAEAQIVATGFVQTFFDETQTAAGGTVQLIADQGNIDVASGAAIDVSSAPSQAGNAGTITLSAANGNLTSNGGAFDFSIIAGSLTGDSGGSLTIDAQSLGTDALAIPALFSNTVDVHVAQGNLLLASDLTAQMITLTADAGTITIDHTINASGTEGGSISLYGGLGVTLAAGGQLLATASDPTQMGGQVVLGTEVASINGSTGPGYIDLAGGLIDVSNTANPANDGTVRLRAPIILTDSTNPANSGNADVAIEPVASTITGAGSVTIEAFDEFDPQNSAFNGVIDPVNQPGFYGSCNAAGHCSGTLLEFVQNFSLSASAQQKFASIPSSVLQLEPGIELVNNDPNVNGGNITVASNWNLGAGTAGFLVNSTSFTANGATVPAGTVITGANGQLLPQYASYTGSLVYESGVSEITSLDYRVGGSVTGEPGTLTLRAAGDVDIEADITDGFFETQNLLDPTYINELNTYIAKVEKNGFTTDATNEGDVLGDDGGYILYYSVAGVAGALANPPTAPYDPTANTISPNSAQILSADLFPLLPGGPIQGSNGATYTAIGSWSYNIAAGADTTSANPLALQPVANFATGAPLAGQGTVTIYGGTTLGKIIADAPTGSIPVPVIVRTGTGSISIAAASDFVLSDKTASGSSTTAPGVVYTAGRNSPPLPDPDYTLETVPDPLNPSQTILAPVASDPDGFLTPDVLTCHTNEGCFPYGVITAPAYPVDGGNLTLSVQQDIQGFEDPSGHVQYFSPWLLTQSTDLPETGFGAFSPLSAYFATDGTLFTPAQTSWWINFGSFDQGLMSVGGNVRITAGGSISQLSVSLPTTAQVSGGLDSFADGELQPPTAPVLHLNDSGNLTVVAGGDLLSGAYYEGSGTATITVGGSVSADWDTGKALQGPEGATNNVSTVLAVDTGSITLQARDSVDIAGVVSGASLQNVGDPSGNFSISDWLFISSYGPNSSVSVQSVSGDIVVNSLANSEALIDNSMISTGASTIDLSAFPGIGRYPASFTAAALLGNVEIENSLQLAPSNTGTMTLLAEGSLETYVENAPGVVQTLLGPEAISTGPSIVEQTFDPALPLEGFAPPASSPLLDEGPLLLHQGDAQPDIFYAVTGDIVSGQSGASFCDVAIEACLAPLSWEINKPSVIRAGLDIVDLPFFGQNLAATDVTQIIAGRDIYYTGAWQLYSDPFRPGLAAPENAAGLSLAGPGIFDIEAGRNLGPFVTSEADIVAADSAVADSVGTGIITFGNTATVGNRLMVQPGTEPITGLENPDQFASGTDFLLPHQGADIVALFGVGPGVNYQGVINAYIDPATSTSPRDYLSDLVVYLQTLGYPYMTTNQAWTTFTTLSPELQDVFVDQVFFDELALTGDPSSCCYQQYGVGYSMIETLFPSSLGYTNNDETGNGKTQRVATGNLDIVHATIKTLESATVPVQQTDGSTSSVAVGGDVMILGPGGNINVGTTAVEVNTKLTNSDVGILTLDNGTIDTFTDGNVLVNQSRILTVEGGNVLMWSSNGDLDAGRGAKTTIDYKPLSVIFSPQDLQTVNLSGLVSGAGIGTIQATPDAPPASAELIAPRGIVNAGAAGLRSSGNIEIAALQVLNAANISVAGTVTGVPQSVSVNLGAVESASASGGQAASAAQQSVAAATNRGSEVTPQPLPSLITVEVLGFGDCGSNPQCR